MEARREWAEPLQETPVVEPVTVSTPDAQPLSDEEATRRDLRVSSSDRRNSTVIAPRSSPARSEQEDTPSPTTDHQARDAEASVAPIQVSCFGRYCITVDERELEPDTDMPEYDKPWELLAYLASQPNLPVARNQILKALWKSQDPDKAAVRLRSVMYRLREVLSQLVAGIDPKVVRCERNGNCYIDTELISSDAHRFVALIRLARKLPPTEAKVDYEEARLLYRDELLTRPRYSWVTSISVEDRFSLRDYYREEYFRISDELAELYVGEGQPSLAIPLYEELLAAEPTLEDIACKLYRCYGQISDRSSLVRAHRQLVLALRALQSLQEEDSELYEPEEETIAVYESVLTAMNATER